jgi:hypothetical protein
MLFLIEDEAQRQKQNWEIDMMFMTKAGNCCSSAVQRERIIGNKLKDQGFDPLPGKLKKIFITRARGEGLTERQKREYDKNM